jgi:hypothetical protein
LNEVRDSHEIPKEQEYMQNDAMDVKLLPIWIPSMGK